MRAICARPLAGAWPGSAGGALRFLGDPAPGCYLGRGEGAGVWPPLLGLDPARLEQVQPGRPATRQGLTPCRSPSAATRPPHRPVRDRLTAGPGLRVPSPDEA